MQQSQKHEVSHDTRPYRLCPLQHTAYLRITVDLLHRHGGAVPMVNWLDDLLEPTEAAKDVERMANIIRSWGDEDNE